MMRPAAMTRTPAELELIRDLASGSSELLRDKAFTQALSDMKNRLINELITSGVMPRDRKDEVIALLKAVEVLRNELDIYVKRGPPHG